MRKLFSLAALAATTLLLVACGGNAFDGTTSTGTGTGTGSTGAGVLTKITVSSSVSTIPADGSSSATITALALDGTNAALAGQTVQFTSSAGTIAVTQATTDSTGKATATLSTGSASPGSSITVTATSGSVSGTTAVVVGAAKQTVSMQTSSPQITSDGTTNATITAFVKDANNNFVPGVVVAFTSTSGGLVVNTPSGAGASPGMTNASGQATATLSVAGDPTNRAITVTGTVGSSNASIVVNVVGTTLSLTGPVSLVMGAQGSYNIALADSGKNPIAGQTVTLTSSAGNTLSANTVTTDASGHATFTLTASKSGSDTVSAAALGLASSVAVSVSNQSFSFTTPAAGALIPLSTNTPVSVKWLSAGTAVGNQTVTFSTTRGTLSSTTAVTDPTTGIATVNISATSAGPAVISATATNSTVTPAVSVSASQAVSFVATDPSQINLQAAPTTIAIKGQSTLTAIVRDPAGNFVQNANVVFTLNDVSGGSLSTGTGTTDSEGVAQTVYTASNSASSTNGVSVTASVVGSNPLISQTATLTVAGSPAHISMGTGPTISENANKTAFLMPWFIALVDAAGNPVANTTVNLTIHSASRPAYAYYKGSYEICGGGWQQYDGNTVGCTTSTPSVPTTPLTPCFNEDLNLTGVYEASEDINNNGVLDPGDPAFTTPGQLTTGSDGTATFTVEYPEDHALWVQVTLTATATVQGTESTTQRTFVLPMLASYLTTTTAQPPGFISPYGIHPSCSVAN